MELEPRLLSETEPTFQVGTGAPPPRGLGTGDAGTAPRVKACLPQPQNSGVAPLAGAYRPSKVNFEAFDQRGASSSNSPDWLFWNTKIREARRRGNLPAAFRDFYGLPQPVQLPDGVKLVLHPLPVIHRNAIQDGDSLTAYVSEENLSCELLNNIEKAKTVSEDEYRMAYALYRVITFGNNIFRKRMFYKGMFYLQCRIRLRGIDAPEYQMPYGDESKEELTNLVLRKQLTLHFYTIDIYGRFVCDIHTHDTFIQEEMLKKGCAWHYSYYDQRRELAQWEKEARENRAGLWLDPNPENPFEFRMRQKYGSAPRGDSIMPMMNNHLSSTGYYQLNPDSSCHGLLRSTL